RCALKLCCRHSGCGGVGAVEPTASACLVPRPGWARCSVVNEPILHEYARAIALIPGVNELLPTQAPRVARAGRGCEELRVELQRERIGRLWVAPPWSRLGNVNGRDTIEAPCRR